jgi:hypothetical protein
MAGPKPPLVFLDIDGVLNHTQWLLDLSQIGRSDASFSEVCPNNVANLSRILYRTGAQVVISSTWRLNHSVPQLTGILCEATLPVNLADRLIGATPDLPGKPRGAEIHQWLVRHRALNRPFCILDDDQDMVPHMSRLVKTTMKTGLTPKLADLAIEMLMPDGQSGV